MKNFKTLVISALCIMLAMASCDKNDKSDSKSDSDKSIVVGTWVGTSQEPGGGGYNEFTLVFEKNGTGTFQMIAYSADGEITFNSTVNLTYTCSDDEGTLKIKESGMEAYFCINRGLLYLYADDECVTFSRKGK